MTTNIRRQLTLFLSPKEAERIEKIRQEFNPIQSELIKSHVTLCREDEIENLDIVITNINRLAHYNMVIEFGKVVRFGNGNGLLLPAKGDNFEFQEVRRKILAGLHDHPRKQEPHITLMHPRNSTCTDVIFEKVKKIDLPSTFEFKSIALIEQKGEGQWKLLEEFGSKENA